MEKACSLWVAAVAAVVVVICTLLSITGTRAVTVVCNTRLNALTPGSW